jgi:hypothetical protein
MRNSLMRDKLAALLVSPPILQAEPLPVYPSDPGLETRKDALIAFAQKRAKETFKRPNPQAFVFGPASKNPFQSISIKHPEIAKPQENAVSAPRYVVPPKKKHPFAVHVYSGPSPSETSEPEEIPEPSLPESPAEEPKEEKIEVPQTKEAPAEEPKIKEPLAVEPEALPEQTSVPTPAPKVVSSAPTVPATVTPAPSLETSETLVPTLPEKEAEEKLAQDETPQLVAALPANLQWLEQPTPFTDHLRPMVDKLRASKTNVVFTLEQSILRQTELKKQIVDLQDKLYKEEFVGEQQREYLHQLDESIAACALLAEQSISVAPLLQALKSPTHKQHPNGEKKTERRAYHRASLDSPSMCHREDVVKIFAANPGRKWSRVELVNELPAAKRAHAKQYLYALLSMLNADGSIQRIAPGIYVAKEKS